MKVRNNQSLVALRFRSAHWFFSAAIRNRLSFVAQLTTLLISLMNSSLKTPRLGCRRVTIYLGNIANMFSKNWRENGIFCNGLYPINCSEKKRVYVTMYYSERKWRVEGYRRATIHGLM